MRDNNTGPANDVSLDATELEACIDVPRETPIKHETRHFIGATRNTFDDALPCRERWPETRRALVLWTQEYLDRELARLPRGEWFDRAFASVARALHREAR